MIKATLTLLAVATLAACEATTTGATDPAAEEYDSPAEAAGPPGAQGEGGAPWWSV